MNLGRNRIQTPGIELKCATEVSLAHFNSRTSSSCSILAQPPRLPTAAWINQPTREARSHNNQRDLVSTGLTPSATPRLRSLRTPWVASGPSGRWHRLFVQQRLPFE